LAIPHDEVRIVGVSRAMPPHYYTQHQIYDELRQYWEDKLDNPAVLERFHQRVGVDGRYFVLPLEDYRELDTWGKANNAWLKAGLELGEKAIDCALKRAGLERKDIDALMFVSVTGISSPSIDALLINRMGLPTNIRRTPIFGLGCVAGASGLAQTADYLRAYPKRVAVLLSVELCSLTWQRGDVTVANMIATGLFGDGASAVVMVGAEHPLAKEVSKGPAVVDAACNFYPNTEDTMGWDISEKGFRIVLNTNVPDVIHANLRRDVDAFLAQHNLTCRDIGNWALHTGGPKVLDAMAESLGVTREDCAVSWDSLRESGNLSSSSVILVLEEILMNRRPKPDTWGLLAAMGPGFCSQAVLLRW